MKHFLLLVMMFVTTVVNAANLLSKEYIGSVYYNFYDDGTAEVTYGTLQSPENYSGDIQIRSSVTLNGKPYTVTAIGEDAFYKCHKLSSIFIPNTVKKIGATAFTGCTGLIEIEIPNSVTSIEDKAFAQCSNLERIDMADAPLKTFAASAFSECSKVKVINLPKTLESIPDKAFAGFYQLRSISIPSKVTYLGERAFYQCSNLERIDMSDAPLKTFGAYAFAGCPKIENISLPNTLVTVPSHAFYCNEGSYTNTSCKGIKIPNSVKTIEDFAFANFSVLENIDLGESVENIGDYAFYFGFSRCYDCHKVTVKGWATEWYEEVYEYQCGDYEYCYYSEWHSREVERDVEITVSGYMYSPCTTLKIPNSVKKIGDYAFANYTNLKTIEFGNSLESIGNFAFFCGDKHETRDSYSESSHDMYDEWYASGTYTAESKNKSLETLNLPESLKSIGDGAFSRLYGLKDLKLPSSVVSVGAQAFCFCQSLKSVEWSPSADIIPYGCFSNCNSLQTFTVPSGVTTIRNGAFYECGLKSITIPNSVIDLETDYYFNYSGYSYTRSSGIFTGCPDCIVYLCNDHISPDHEAFKPVKKNCFM